MDWFSGKAVLSGTTPQGTEFEITWNDVSFTQAHNQMNDLKSRGFIIKYSMYYPYPTQFHGE